ncbi:Integrase family protein (fragment) [Vibrio coralliirubri]
MSRTIVKQQKTQQEVHFEITQKTQQTLSQWIIQNSLLPTDDLFPRTRREGSPFHTITTPPWLIDGLLISG